MSTDDGRVVGATRIVDHGPDAARWNLVLLAEGYRDTELSQFGNDAQDFVTTLFATPPFDNLQGAINVHRIDVASTDSGADRETSCNDTTDVKTYFDATYCSGGIDRLLTVDTATVREVVEEEVPPWDVAMVIVNATTYGGSGADGVPVFSLDPDANQIGLHELGHSGFGLADEYGNLKGCNQSELDEDNKAGHDRYDDLEPVEPNITAETDRDAIKWGHLIDEATPLPTTENPDCDACPTQPSPFPADTVGAYEGAGHYHCELYRPQHDCQMNHLAEPFCAVCQERIHETLTPYMPRREPMNYTVISRVRAHLGDEEGAFPGRFAGRQAEWTFDCPGIDPSRDAVLMFQSLAVDWPTNVFTINDETVFGDLPTTGGDKEAWTGNVLLVTPGTLEPTGNVLHVEARNKSGGTSGNLEDFVIDNLVLFYKTA